ncbi:hypothetical protein F3087_42300 [Nocardia colli]|uniref:EfeO-type cupredoxin-like domain-containing protein n=1 Tax=Nocardia colli TaxID=2545717 RepID=A0A5N0DTD1_9NOCA|nr:hypothetical protein [Nocardia colli]KAA8880043.1 hypothetical protein F3087_42300 [Nocardia colli]
MIRAARTSALAALLVVSGTMTACGSSVDAPAARTSASASVDVPAEVILSVRIANGSVTPTNTRTDARQFQPIVIKVDSDVADELHVHSEPSQTFAVEPKAGQEFRFIVTVPGRVDVELHHAGKTVTTLLIRQ